jgi:DNA recombination protein RmuC
MPDAMADALLLAVLFVAFAGAVLAALVLLRLNRETGEDGEVQRLRLEQIAAGQRAEAETLRAQLANAERALAARAEQSRLEAGEAFGRLQTALVREQGEAKALLESKLREMGEQSAGSLAQIRRAVDEQLHQAVEKQMTQSFARVADQFTQVQRVMAEVQGVTAQIGDLKRLFGNVKTRGGWGETHLQALLDDVLPGQYETNCRLTEGSGEVVEFAIPMPVRGADRPLLAVDAKFPVEDYERLLAAGDAGDADGEARARRALGERIRAEARSIAEKYIVPPRTVEFAVLYLPTDGLYVEVARLPGLIQAIGRDHRILVTGPSLCPALLRTISLGFLTLAIEAQAGEIKNLLGATRTEMGKFAAVLDKLGDQAGRFSNTIEDARKRTRVMDRKLRSIERLGTAEAAAALELEEEA